MGDADRKPTEDGLGGGVTPEPLNGVEALTMCGLCGVLGSHLCSDGSFKLVRRPTVLDESLAKLCEPGGSFWAHAVHVVYGAAFDPDCPLCLNVLRGAAYRRQQAMRLPRGI